MTVSIQPFKYALATNATGTTFADLNATTTEPSGSGIFDLLSIANGVGLGAQVPEYLQLIPFGKNADNETFDMRLYGYNATERTASLAPIYIPQLLLDLSVVLCARTFTDHAADTFLADTLTVNDGGADNGLWQRITDCQEDMVASVIVHTRACRYIRFDFDADAGGSASASANCLWRPFSHKH